MILLVFLILKKITKRP